MSNRINTRLLFSLQSLANDPLQETNDKNTDTKIESSKVFLET